MCIKEQEKKAGERGSHSRERSAQSMNGSRVAGASRMEAGDGQGRGCSSSTFPPVPDPEASAPSCIHSWP